MSAQSPDAEGGRRGRWPSSTSTGQVPLGGGGQVFQQGPGHGAMGGRRGQVKVGAPVGLHKPVWVPGSFMRAGGQLSRRRGCVHLVPVSVCTRPVSPRGVGQEHGRCPLGPPTIPPAHRPQWPSLSPAGCRRLELAQRCGPRDRCLTEGPRWCLHPPLPGCQPPKSSMWPSSHGRASGNEPVKTGLQLSRWAVPGEPSASKPQGPFPLEGGP